MFNVAQIQQYGTPESATMRHSIKFSYRAPTGTRLSKGPRLRLSRALEMANVLESPNPL
jgi:hypothetical protein